VGVVFAVCLARMHLPGVGLTSTLQIGDQFVGEALPRLREVPVFVLQGSPGYDGQFYVQMALQPDLGDPALDRAVDNLPYRARRILFSWTAWLLGLGQPEWIVHAYSLQNVLAWLALAVLLWRWLPPDSWGSWLRWTAVLYSVGLLASVRGALVDGPSLAVLALAVACIERGRAWCGAALCGVAGLGKETNILAGLAAWERWPRRGREWLDLMGRGAVVVAPLALWLVVLGGWIGAAANAGLGNFAAPFSGYVGRWREIATEVAAMGWNEFRVANVLVHVGLTVQVLFLAWPRWRAAWWRAALPYLALGAVLGPAVWEGFPGAAARVLLPLTVAFNVLVPRGPRWWPVLVLGNLGVLATPLFWNLPPHTERLVLGPPALVQPTAAGARVELAFLRGWHEPEDTPRRYWRWAEGDATLRVFNPHPDAVRGRLLGWLHSTDEREVAARVAGREIGRWRLGGSPVRFDLGELRVPPGGLEIEWVNDRPAVPAPPGDDRELTFRLQDYVLTLRARDPPAGTAGP
jgi:hypothetical protein